MKKTHQFLLTVIGKDRPGIISKVTRVLFERRCNLEDISMTVLEGEFAMMLIAENRSQTQLRRLSASLQRLEQSMGLTIYKKDFSGLLKREKANTRVKRCIVTAIGRDKNGLVYEVTKALAAKRLNITDLNSKILGKGKKTLYAMTLEMDVPSRTSFRSLEGALQRLQKKLKIDISLRPVESYSF